MIYMVSSWCRCKYNSSADFNVIFKKNSVSVTLYSIIVCESITY